jgi:hypothetical protein
VIVKDVSLGSHKASSPSIQLASSEFITYPFCVISPSYSQSISIHEPQMEGVLGSCCRPNAQPSKFVRGRFKRSLAKGICDLEAYLQLMLELLQFRLQFGVIFSHLAPQSSSLGSLKLPHRLLKGVQRVCSRGFDETCTCRENIKPFELHGNPGGVD